MLFSFLHNDTVSRGFGQRTALSHFVVLFFLFRNRNYTILLFLNGGPLPFFCFVILIILKNANTFCDFAFFYRLVIRRPKKKKTAMPVAPIIEHQVHPIQCYFCHFFRCLLSPYMLCYSDELKHIFYEYTVHYPTVI